MNKRNIFRQLFLAILFFSATFSAPSFALTTSFTVQQLTDFLSGYRNSNDPNKKLLWNDLQQKFAAKGIPLNQTSLTYFGIAPARSEPAHPWPACKGMKTDWHSAIPWSVSLTNKGTSFSLDTQRRINFNTSLSAGMAAFSTLSHAYYEDNPLPNTQNCWQVFQISTTANINALMSMGMNISFDVALTQNTLGRYQLVINSPAIIGSANFDNFNIYFNDGNFLVDGLLNTFLTFSTITNPALLAGVNNQLQATLNSKLATLTTELPGVYDLRSSRHPRLHPNQNTQ